MTTSDRPIPAEDVRALVERLRIPFADHTGAVHVDRLHAEAVAAIERLERENAELREELKNWNAADSAAVKDLRAELDRLRAAPWPGQANVVLEAYRAAETDPHCEVPHDDMAELIDRLVRELDRLRPAAEALARLEEWLGADDNVAECVHDKMGFQVWLHGEQVHGEGPTLAAAILAALRKANNPQPKE